MLRELSRRDEDIAADTCEKLVQCALAKSRDMGGVDADLNAVAVRVMEMPETREAFEEVYALLRDHLEKPKNPSPDWKPKHTGLVFVDGSSTCDGSSAWVSPEAVSTFQRLGRRALLELN